MLSEIIVEVGGTVEVGALLGNIGDGAGAAPAPKPAAKAAEAAPAPAPAAPAPADDTESIHVSAIIDDGEATQGRLKVALELAERFEAHLTGVYVDPGLALPTLIDVPISPNLIEELENEHRDRREVEDEEATGANEQTVGHDETGGASRPR